MEIISYKYAIPYIIFFLYLVLLMFWEFFYLEKYESIRIIRWLTIFGFLFFFGLRGFVGTDWYYYYPFFNSVGTFWSGGFLNSFSSPYEIGFTLYTILVKSIWPNYFFWIFINSFLDIVLLNIIFKRYSKYYVLAVIIFLSFNGFIMEINLMRNVKSILLFLLSINYLQQRRIVPYMLLNLLGASIHFSSIIYLPLYFILHREIPKITLWILFIIGILIFLFQVEYIKPIMSFFADIFGGRLSSKVNAYFEYKYYNQYKVFSLGFIERVLTFILFMKLKPLLVKQNKFNNILFNIFILFLICCFYIAEASEVSTRLATLFVCAYWILFPNILSVIKKKINLQLLFVLLICISVLKTSLYNSYLFKYDNHMFGIEEYEVRKEKFDKYSNTGIIKK